MSLKVCDNIYEVLLMVWCLESIVYFESRVMVPCEYSGL